MKKVCIFFAALLLSVYLTMLFSLTPAFIISKINAIQDALRVSSERAEGNLLTGYRLGEAVFSDRNGRELLVIDEMLVKVRILPLLLGRIGVDIESKEIAGSLSLGLRGLINGEINFRDIRFNSASYISEDSISLAALLSGRAVLSGGRADLEFRTDDLSWKRLNISGIELPLDLFSSSRGALSVDGERILIKSLALEGGKGYARLSGEIIGSRRKLLLELFPNDWSDIMLMALDRHKVSPGHYRIALN